MIISQKQKEMLEKYIQTDREIDRKLDEVLKWRSMLEKITSVCSDMPRGGGSVHPKQEAIIAKIVDLEAEIDKKIDALISLREGLEGIIDSVENPEQREILTRKYVLGQSYRAIGFSMGYSRETVKRRNREMFKK